MDFSSIRPSSWNGVGAMAKVPVAVWVSFMVSPVDDPQGYTGFSSLRGALATKQSSRRPGLWIASLSLAMTALCSKPPRRFFHRVLRKENLPGMIDDILRLPSRVRRFPAVHFHHPHLAHAARAGDAEHLSGLIAGQVGHHV